MSYSITVRVKDGTATALTSPVAPDGIYVVHGHVDEHREDISVERQTPDGRLASCVSTVVYKEV